MTIQVNKKRLAAQLKGALALQSPTVIQSCISTIERECKKFGVEGPVKYFGDPEPLDFNLSDKYIYMTVSLDKVDYDAIMSNKNSSISSLEHINCNYTIIQVLVGYDIELKINFSCTCPLPKDDLITLRNIGKVKVEHNRRSYTSESIYCEIPF